MSVGNSLTRNLRCEASEVEGQAATGRGVVSDWQVERRLPEVATIEVFQPIEADFV